MVQQSEGNLGGLMDYQGNSNKGKGKQVEKTEKPQIEKVVSGEVVRRERSLGRRFKDVFFGGEFKSAIRYVAADILLPSARNMFADAGKGAIDRMIYGDTGRSRGRPSHMGPRVSYNNPINRAARDPRERVSLPDQPPHPYRQSQHEASEIIIASREEAELVLERLIDIVDQYDHASLADLYDLVGLASGHVDNKWGWSYLSNARVTQVREGYLLELPPMEAL